MAIKPILFNTEMVNALLDGRKTVTRRVIKPIPSGDGSKPEPLPTRSEYWNTWGDDNVYRQPYEPGDVLWVRETWANVDDRYVYHASDNTPYRWRPSIHMPKVAARIFLRVTDVRVERLQDITNEQAIKEGAFVKPYHCQENNCDLRNDVSKCQGGRCDFERLWDSTVDKKDLDRYGWDANPYVWVIEFEQISREDAIREGWSACTMI